MINYTYVFCQQKEEHEGERPFCKGKLVCGFFYTRGFPGNFSLELIKRHQLINTRDSSRSYQAHFLILSTIGVDNMRGLMKDRYLISRDLWSSWNLSLRMICIRVYRRVPNKTDMNMPRPIIGEVKFKVFSRTDRRNNMSVHRWRWIERFCVISWFLI